MSQRIKLKLMPSESLLADLVTELAMLGFNIQVEPCEETDHYTMITELTYEGEAPTVLPNGPTIH